MKRLLALAIGVLASLLGGLWLLQGLGLVRIKPVACVAACEAIDGPSPVWALIGLAVLAGGLFLVFLGLRRRRGPRDG